MAPPAFTSKEIENGKIMSNIKFIEAALETYRARERILNIELSDVSEIIRRLEDGLGELRIDAFFATHPELEALHFGDKVLDLRPQYAHSPDNVWIVYSTDSSGNFDLTLGNDRLLRMGGGYEWVIKMRHDYLESALATDNSPSQG